MPFNREWTKTNGTYGYESNRDRTGPPPPPPTGTVVEEDGSVVVASQNKYPQIPPARPVNVTFPGPNEPIVGQDGRITPRWWRFLDELYRRTGGVVDNINKAPVIYLPLGAPDALAFSSDAPTVLNPDNIRTPSTVSTTLTGITIADVLNAAP